MQRCVGVVIAIAALSSAAIADDEPAKRPTGSFTIGVGYSPDEQVSALAEVRQDDLFGTGQKLVLATEISALRQQFKFMHEVPDLLGTGLSLQSELFNVRRDYGPFTRGNAGGAVTLGTQLHRTTRVYTRYRVEHVTLDFDELAPRAAPRALGDGLLATLGAGVIYDTRDAPVWPRTGTLVEVFGERASRAIGSEYELERIGGAIEHARPFGPFTLRMLGRASYVRSREPGGVPLAHRIFTLGHADVRGYRLDASRNLVGDNYAATGGLELELPLIPRAGISVAAFADIGYRDATDPVWTSFAPSLQRSVGASLLWRSPIGRIRLDVALPLDGNDRRPQWLLVIP